MSLSSEFWNNFWFKNFLNAFLDHLKISRDFHLQLLLTMCVIVTVKSISVALVFITGEPSWLGPGCISAADCTCLKIQWQNGWQLCKPITAWESAFTVMDKKIPDLHPVLSK